MTGDYVHGYSAVESTRLRDQAETLADLLHHDTAYPVGARVLEAGCGVGAQTQSLVRSSPDAEFVAVDISEASLVEAAERMSRVGATNVAFLRADVYRLPFAASSFDHVFVCFLLEHLADPRQALAELGRVLVPGGSITVIEGDHGSALFHPESEMARKAIRCLIDLQRLSGGDSLIGRRLYPLLRDCGFRDVWVSPRLVYADASRPGMVDGFTRKTFTAMVEGVGEQAIASRMIDAASWARGIEDLRRTAEQDGTFSYTFYKGVAVR